MIRHEADFASNPRTALMVKHVAKMSAEDKALIGQQAEATLDGLLAPTGTPASIIDRLNREVVQVVNSPDFVKLVSNEGAMPVGNTPAEFAKVIRADIDKWAKVIRHAGIKPE